VINFTHSTPDEREQLLGSEFRNIHVIDACTEGQHWVTKILWQGEVLVLVGGPVEGLRVHLAGRQSGGGSA
jgi:hypothetical protein